MPRPSTLELYDQIHRGKVSRTIRDGRVAGDSFDTIARRLDKLGVVVSGETVRRWAQRLDGRAA